MQEGCYFEIKHSWDGVFIEDHDIIKVSLKWHFQRIAGNPHKRVIQVEVRAPLFDDPEPEAFAGPCPGVCYLC